MLSPQVATTQQHERFGCALQRSHLVKKKQQHYQFLSLVEALIILKDKIYWSKDIKLNNYTELKFIVSIFYWYE